MEALIHPLFAIEPRGWEPPDPARFDTLMLSSANTLRQGGRALALYHHLPAFAVGETTARATAGAGFADVTIAGPDATATLKRIMQAGHRHVLHLGGEDVRPAAADGVEVVHRAVYRAVEAGDAKELAIILARNPVILVHSPRAGARLAALVPEDARARLSLIAISTAARAAAGTGWQQTAAADFPRDSAMLALARSLCL